MGPDRSAGILLEEEAHGRAAATIANRRRKAQFPTGKTFESLAARRLLDPRGDPTGRKHSCIRRAENLAVVGPSGHDVRFRVVARGWPRPSIHHQGTSERSRVSEPTNKRGA